MEDKDSRRIETSAFLFTEMTTLESNVPTAAKSKMKLVLLLSSMHTQLTPGITSKPEVVKFYNHTKGGVDTLNQLYGHYSCELKPKDGHCVCSTG